MRALGVVSDQGPELPLDLLDLLRVDDHHVVSAEDRKADAIGGYGFRKKFRDSPSDSAIDDV